jgi:hypothetical protein
MRIEIALKLINELNKLANLFGPKAAFGFKDRMFKNQHQAPLPEFALEEIANNRSGHT